MKPETEQLLGTLEILSNKAFLWEIEKQGEFNLWNLMLSQGFIKETDVDLVIQHWQNIEIWGTPTNQTTNDYEYAPYREEREEEEQEEDWNDEIAKQRKKYYLELSKLCQEGLDDIQAYTLKTSTSGWEWEHPDFYVSLIVGKTNNNNWVCLAPIVEDLCFYERNIAPHQPIDKTQDSTIEKIDYILNKLTPITLYDYYYGGYDMTHQHQIVKGVGSTKEKAIASALQRSGMVIWQPTEVNIIGNRNNSDRLHQFMNQCLQDRTYCRISFWDVGYSFDFGKTPVNDWIGISAEAEFEYNP